MLALIGEPAHARSAIVENRSAGSAVIAAVPARDHNSSRVFVGKKLSSLLAEFQPFDKRREEVLMLPHVHRKLHLALQIRVIAPLPQRLVNGLYVPHLAEENYLPFQLPLVLLEILFVLGIDPNCLPALRSVARGRPRQSLRDEHGGVRRGHSN